MSNRLAGSIAYLAGPMDRIADRGVEWRLDMQEFLWANNIGVLNPCSKPINWGVEDEASRQWRHESLRQAEDMYSRGLEYDANHICEAVSDQMKCVVASDFRCVDKADFTILYIDTAVHMCGSYAEETTAALQRKPVIICCKQGRFKVPDWLWGACKHEMFFSTWEEVKDYISHVAYAEHVEHLKRWQFFDINKIYHREIF